MKRRCVFLDRDGVLNRAIVRNGRPYPPARPDEFELVPGAAETCAALHAAGFLVIVVTNQPDVARGTQKREVVDEINRLLEAQAEVDEIRVCFHDEGDGCECRKPRAGLLLQAAQAWNIALESSYMIGDRRKDIEAGRRAGCTTIFIDYGYAETQPAAPDYRAGSLKEAGEWIITREAARSAAKAHSDLRYQA